VGGDDAGGEAQAAHEGILGGGDVEEAVEFEKEDVEAGGIFAFVGVGADFVPDVQAVRLALGLFFVDEFFAGLDEAVLGFEMNAFGAGRKIFTGWRVN